MRTWFHLTKTLLLSVILITGCSLSSNQDAVESQEPRVPVTSGEAEAVTNQVKLAFAVYTDEETMYKALVSQFEQDNPDITIRLVPLDTIINTSESSAPQSEATLLQRAARQADILPAFLVASDERTSPLILDLRPLMDADANFATADFYPTPLEQATIEGHMWMMPSSFRLPLLAYNNRMFTRQGLAPPSPTWTWSDLLRTAEQLAAHGETDDNHFGLLDPSDGVLALSAILQAQGDRLQLQSLDTLDLDRPAVVAAIQEVQRLVKMRALLLPGSLPIAEQETVDIQQLILDGQIALWPENALSIGADTSTGLDTGRVVYPLGENPRVGQQSYGFVISAGTRHPQEAWRWVAFLSHQSLVGLSSVAPGHIPARSSVAEEHDIWQRLPPDIAAAYEAGLDRQASNTLQASTIDPVAFDVVQQALTQVLAGEQDIAQLLADTQRQLDEQHSIGATTDATTTPPEPVTVATPPPEPDPGTTAITFMTPRSIPDVTRLTELFHEQRPDIQVNIASTNVLTSAPSLASLAQMSDCFLWRGSPETPTEATAVLDLQPLLDADAALPTSEYAPMLLALYQDEQRLTGLPYVFRLHTLSYNQELFAASQTPLPELTWTPEDFLATASLLTDQQGDQTVYGYVPLLDPGRDLIFFIRQFGGQLVTGSGFNAQPHFTDPTVLRAIQWYLDLSAVHKVAPKPTFTYKQNTYFGAETQELIQQGRAGMWFTWGIQPPEPLGFTIGNAPLPVGQGGVSSADARTHALFISAQTQQAEACWAWMSFLSRYPPREDAYIPARLSIAESSDWQSQAMTDTVNLYQTYRTAIAEGQPVNETSGWQSIDWYWFYDALTQVVEEQADLPSALDQAQQRTSSFMECLQREEEPMTCALKVDPLYQGYNLEVTPVPGGG